MSSEMEVYCPECRKLFVSEGAMLDHYSEEHGGIGFPCSKCGKTFKTLQELRAHTEEHEKEQRDEEQKKAMATRIEEINLEIEEQKKAKATRIEETNSEIEKCEAKLREVAVLYADGKISQQSYITIVKTLERKLENLKEVRDNPSIELPPLRESETKPALKPGTSDQTRIAAGIIIAIIIFSVIGGAFWWFSMRSFPGMSEATFTIAIESDTEWSGAIGGLGGSTTRSGSGSASFTIHSSIVSACIQKQTEWGYLTVKILRNGQLVEQQSTSAAYGVVVVSASS